MNEAKSKALNMINEIIDHVIENDCLGYIDFLEEEYEMTVDEALREIQKN